MGVWEWEVCWYVGVWEWEVCRCVGMSRRLGEVCSVWVRRCAGVDGILGEEPVPHMFSLSLCFFSPLLPPLPLYSFLLSLHSLSCPVIPLPSFLPLLSFPFSPSLPPLLPSFLFLLIRLTQLALRRPLHLQPDASGGEVPTDKDALRRRAEDQWL